MASFVTMKFREAAEADIFLNGGLIGGASVVGGAEGAYGRYELVGKTLLFSQPSVVTVTFVESTDPNNPDPQRLTYKDIKAQIEAAIPAVSVQQYSGRLLLIEVAPSAGVTIAHNGTANGIFGFDRATASVGTKYGPIGGSAPALAAAYSISGLHAVVVYK